MTGTATERLRGYYREILVAVLLAGLTFFGSYRIQQHLNPVVFEYGNTNPDSAGYRTTNIWFDGDLPKIRKISENRVVQLASFSAKHPLYWPAAWAGNHLLEMAGVDPLERLRIPTALAAVAWTIGMFALLRMVTGRLLDATLLTGLAMTSASALFWGVVPEVFLPGSLTIIAALYLAARAGKQVASTPAYVIVSAATLSVTVTNWMVGILATLASHPWRKAFQITVNGFALVSVLWGVQKMVVPNSVYFLTLHEGDRDFILDSGSGGPLTVTSAFVFHTMVMPEIQVASSTKPLWRGLTVQSSAPGSGSRWGAAAALTWLLLLGAGVYGLITLPKPAELRLVLAASLILQLLLHVVYGRETFLYSMHFVPLLICLAAFATLTRWRTAALSLIVITMVAAGINNWIQMENAFSVVRDIAVASGHAS